MCVSKPQQRGSSTKHLRESLTNTIQHQYELLDVLAFNFCSGEYRLLVIDSVMALFRTDYSGRGELAERQQALGQFLKRLAALAEEFNVCVVMVSLTAIAPILFRLTYPRQIRCNLTREPALYSPVLMGVNLLAVMFSRTPRPQGFCFVKAVEKSGLQRSLIHLVSPISNCIIPVC